MEEGRMDGKRPVACGEGADGWRGLEVRWEKEKGRRDGEGVEGWGIGAEER